MTFSQQPPETKPAYVYHYTSACTALMHILPALRIRLSAVGDTNDPWEIRPLADGVAFDPMNLDGLEDKLRDLHAIVKRARLACFGQDDPTLDGPDGSSRCGWARDRMWAQYADNHRGVCLWFDRAKLVEAFRAALSSRGECLADPVTYSDKSKLPSLKADAAAARGDDYLREYRRTEAETRYFRKREDWAAEREFRLLLLEKCDTPGPAYVPVGGGVLAGTTVGYRFAEDAAPTLGALCEAARVPISQIVYSDRVILNPFKGPLSLDRLPTPWP